MLLPGAQAPLTLIWPRLLTTLSTAASPDRALINFARFVQDAPAPADLLQRLAADPRLTEILVTLFSGSQFLTEILLRHPDYLSIVSERAALSQIKSASQFEAAARGAMGFGETQDSPHLDPATASNAATAFDALRRFQRAEFLRIGISDLCALLDLPSVTQQLSHLAEGVVRASLAHVTQSMGIAPGEFVVLAMGKLGGCELNYSSDIDLLFLAAENASDYERLGERLIAGLTAATGEGFLYRVDMRLRPWGAVGPLVSTTRGVSEIPAQKRPALGKAGAPARPSDCRGFRASVTRSLHDVSDQLFTLNPEATRSDVHAMKQRTEARLRELGRRGARSSSVKVRSGMWSSSSSSCN